MGEPEASDWRWCIPVVVILFLIAEVPVAAQELDDWDRFRFWNGCGALGLVIDLDSQVRSTGLSERQIESRVRRALEAAELYDPEAERGYLFVKVRVAGAVRVVDFEFYKWMLDTLSGTSGYVAAWSQRGVGAREAEQILAGLAARTDEFIAEFLRVNADACHQQTP